MADGITLEVPRKSSSLVAKVGQEELYAFEGEEVVMTVRLSKEADK